VTPEQITELAQRINSGVVWSQFPFYLLIVAIAIVLIYLYRRLDGYSKKVGEIHATTANFALLLQQSRASAEAAELGKQAAITAQFEKLRAELKANTETVEKVKVEIAHGDLAVREWKTLRRVKLEQLLENVYKGEQWRRTFCDQKIFQGQIDAGESPIPQIEMICLLYFPELAGQAFDCCQAHNAYLLFVLDYASKLIPSDAAAQTAYNSGRFADSEAAIAVATEIRQQFNADSVHMMQRLRLVQESLGMAARNIFVEIVGGTGDHH